MRRRSGRQAAENYLSARMNTSNESCDFTGRAVELQDTLNPIEDEPATPVQLPASIWEAASRLEVNRSARNTRFPPIGRLKDGPASRWVSFRPPRAHQDPSAPRVEFHLLLAPPPYLPTELPWLTWGGGASVLRGWRAKITILIIKCLRKI